MTILNSFLDSFDLVVNNYEKNFKVYKYKNEINNPNDINVLTNAFKNWNTVEDDIIYQVKEIVAKYTDNNINTYGTTYVDNIHLTDKNEKNKNYHVVFTNNCINIYYIDGLYDVVHNDFDFNTLIMMISY